MDQSIDMRPTDVWRHFAVHIDTAADDDEKVSAARIVSFLEENGYLDVE